MNLALRPPRGPSGRRAVVAAGVAGLLLSGLFAAEGGDTVSPPRQPAGLARAGPGAGAALATEPGAVTLGLLLLDQAAVAARRMPYQGVQVFSWLAPGGGGWLRTVPGTVSMPVSHRTGQPPDVVLGLSPALVRLLSSHYVVVYSGPGSAAGRPASVVEVLRRDGSIAARFWLDRATMLPLRREIFDRSARMISVDDLAGLKFGGPGAGFAPQQAASRGAGAATKRGAAGSAGKQAAGGPASPAVAGSASPPGAVVARAIASITAAMTMSGFAGPPAEPAGRGGVATARPWTDRLDRTRLATLHAEGWPVPGGLPGGLTLCGASESGTASGRVVHLAYSDGLSVVSLFLQRGQLPVALPGWRHTRLSGNLLYLRNPAEPDLTWSAGGYVYTLVAGAPAQVIASVVDSLPHQAAPGFWGRMAHGIGRVLSWFDPFA